MQIYRCVNQILFCSAYSLMRGVFCRKQTCTVIVMLVRPSILLIALAPASVDRLSDIDNRDLRLRCLHSKPHQGGPRRNIAMTSGMEKLEWFGYPMVKNWRYIYLFRQSARTWQTDRQTVGQTDRHRTTA